MPAYYTVESAGDGYHRWRVKHRASGAYVTPLGILATVTKPQADLWRARCERVAPTDDPEAATAMLIADRFPHDVSDEITRPYREAIPSPIPACLED